MRFLFLSFALLLNTLAQAQLSGNYTIGGATAATNYATWSDFTSAISSNGVSGNVSVKVMSDLTVTAAVELKQNSSNPTSSSKKISIDGNGKKLTGSLIYEVLYLNGIDFVEIQNLTVVNSTTASTGICVRLANGADDNVLSSCALEFSNIASSGSPSAAYLAFATSQSNVLTISSSNNGVRNTIKNCTMTTTATNSPGPLYAIVDQQGSATYSGTGTENAISGNVIKNFFKTAILLQYVNGEVVSGNDISRSAVGGSAPVDTVVTGIRITNGACTNASIQLVNNAIHDLPYSGAGSGSTTNYISRFWGIACGAVSGKSTYPVVFSGNGFKRIAVLNNFVGIEMAKGQYFLVKKNEMNRLLADKSGNSYGLNIQTISDLDVVGNVVRSCQFGSNSGGGRVMFFGDCGNAGYSWNRIEDNVLDSNKAGDQLVCLAVYDDGDWQINRNKILLNQTTSTKSSFNGVYLWFLHDVVFNSNLIARNEGYNQTDNFYVVNYNTGYKTEVRQNTVYSRPSSLSTHVGLGYYLEDESEVTFVGNVLDIRGDDFGYGINVWSSTKMKELNHNTCFVRFAGGEQWGVESNYYSSWSDYKAGGTAGSGEYFGNPGWVDVAKNDFRSAIFENQNNVPTVANNDMDVSGVKRSTVKSDRGSTESVMDLAAVKTTFSIASQICSGYEGKVNITVKNNYTDTASKFNVAYSLNGVATRQWVSSKILPKDSLSIDFTVPLKISAAGNAVIQIFVEGFDDVRKNDTLTFKTFVKPAPGGGYYEFSAKTQTGNNPVYQRGKPLDVTVLDVPVIYDIKAPRLYTNAQYGSGSTSKWNASVSAISPSGRAVTGATLTAPTASADLELQFKTSDAGLEDSLITILLKISDLSNGCDTVLKRQVFIYPAVTTDFTLPNKVCIGDTVKFVNTSKYKSGYVENWWSYGTGDPNDTSNLVDGEFIFKKAGTYTVKLRGTTNPHGFVFEKSMAVVVNAIPKATFTRQNACVGESVKFVNQTTPTTAKMYWDFGDGKGFVLNNATNISLNYGAAGTYVVTLKADISGCEATETQKVYQFVVPKASFNTLSGRCNGDAFTFQNNSSIATGNIGSKWYFNHPDSSSNDLNPSYVFNTSGSKSVKLVVKSEFGCKDSQTRTVTVFESPKVAFKYDAACIRTSTQFTNETPAVAGAVANYSWNFGDGKTATASSPLHGWTSLGKKQVVFTVKLDNGCTDSTTALLDILMQPTADFTAAPVCSGEELSFLNKSTTASGTMSYEWEFGDNSNSTLESPKKRYTVKQTTAYNVTLVVRLKDGCADSVTKAVTIQELPRTCDFMASPDYQFAFFGLALEPVDDVQVAGGQAGIDYTWTVAGLGIKNSKDVNAKVNYDLQQDGVYTVTVKSVVRTTGCECSKTKQVVMDRASVQATDITTLQVYPNPTIDLLWVRIPSGMRATEYCIRNAMGALVAQGAVREQSLIAVDLPQLSAGLYTLELLGDQGKKEAKFVVADHR